MMTIRLFLFSLATIFMICISQLVLSATVQDFDNFGTSYTSTQCVAPPGALPEVIPGGVTGNFFRLATTPAVQQNTISFSLTDPGTFAYQIVADFDFRITPQTGQADGFGFALLNTAEYGVIGSVCPTLSPYASEEPNFTASIGIGFDIYQSAGELNNNHLSLHFNGVMLQEFDAAPVNLAGGEWNHAQIIMRPGNNFSDVTVIITPTGGSPVTVIDQFQIQGFTPYEGRILFGARSGGESADHDLDNINVQFTEVPADIYGQWGGLIDSQVVPIHMHMLPTGKVLYWKDGGHGVTLIDEIRLWDPITEAVSMPSLPGHDIFCTGHSFLEDGSLFVTGGHDEADNVGLPNASLYNPYTDTWTNVTDMNAGRWYPTNTTLANGDVLVLSGEINNGPKNPLPQVWEAASGSWRDLLNAEDVFPLGGDLYPRMILAPDGRVFRADPTPPDGHTWYLDTTGLGFWILGPLSNFGKVRDYGSAVQYGDGKILVMGGGGNDPQNPLEPPTATAEVIDLTATIPAWRYVSPMLFGRRHHNATLLPDGKVFVVGGTSSATFNDATGAVHVAEIWDPETEEWATMAGMLGPRVYHSTAILLPDGRVLVGGGGRPAPGPAGHQDRPDFEIYSPPYLFKGVQPIITGLSKVKLNYGQNFFVQTPNATSITHVNWIRLASVTHAFDQNQRINHLSFIQTQQGLNVTVPTNPNLAPPGHYMLFILDDKGIPSVASIVQLTTLPSVQPSISTPPMNSNQPKDNNGGAIGFLEMLSLALLMLISAIARRGITGIYESSQK